MKIQYMSRQLARRQKNYPQMVADGKITKEAAQEDIRMVEGIHETLCRLQFAGDDTK